MDTFNDIPVGGSKIIRMSGRSPVIENEFVRTKLKEWTFVGYQITVSESYINNNGIEVYITFVGVPIGNPKMSDAWIHSNTLSQMTGLIIGEYQILRDKCDELEAAKKKVS